MDILSDHRITALIVSERELVQRAEWARVADERAAFAAPTPARTVTSTGSLACVPVSH